MRLIFMGTPDFAVPTLDALVAAGHEIALVVAQPDAPAGRGQELRVQPVAARAKALGLPLTQPKAVRTGELPERFEALEADAAVVIAYGRILTPRLLAAPRLGCVNIHGSLLPRWRGAAPIQWAILAGDPETGVCTQRMEEGLDTGPIYLAEHTPIGPRDTGGALFERLAGMSAGIAVRTLEILPHARPVPQADAWATWASKVDREMGRIRWDQPADAVDRRVRAMTPWPGAWTPLPDGPLKIREVLPTEGAGVPGHVVSVSPLVIACGEGAVELVSVQAPGKKPVTGHQYANGARLQVGAHLAGAPR